MPARREKINWHSVRGRCRGLRRLGVAEQMLRYVPTRRGEWYVRRSGCDAHRLVERDLVALRVRDAIESRGTMTATGSNRGIRKTVRPVAWEGAGAQSPSSDPIAAGPTFQLRRTRDAGLLKRELLGAVSAKSPPASWNAAIERHSAIETGANGASIVRGGRRGGRRPCIRAADWSTLTVPGWPKRKSQGKLRPSRGFLYLTSVFATQPCPDMRTMCPWRRS